MKVNRSALDRGTPISYAVMVPNDLPPISAPVVVPDVPCTLRSYTPEPLSPLKLNPCPDSRPYHYFTKIFCTCCGKEISVPVYCGSRFCPVCLKPRLSRVRNRLRWICAQILPRNGYRMKFLTLTVRNQADLSEMVDHLLKSFKKIRNSRFWKTRVQGGAFVLEVTGVPNNWHAHLHIILFARFLKQSVLVTEWIRCSGSRGVYIKEIPSSKAINYVTKYLSKTKDEVPFHDLKSSVLKGRRLFQPFGDWHGFSFGVGKSPSVCHSCKAVDSFDMCVIIYGGDFREWLPVPNILS